MTLLPPLELHAEIETADTLVEYRLDANARDATNRPLSASCGSRLMEGFGNAGVTVARDITRTYPDLGIYNTMRLVGTDGSIAYEGYLSRTPRSTDSGHRISLEAVGWMTHARDTPMMFLGVDQDIAAWGEMSAARLASLQTLSFAPKGAGTVMGDRTLSQIIDGAWVAGEIPIYEAWYDAGQENGLGGIYYDSTPGPNVSEADANWFWSVWAADDSGGTNSTGPGDLQGAAANAGLYVPAVLGKRYAYTQFYYAVAGGAADTQYDLAWNALQTVGNHGLTLKGAGPYGLLGSDIIRYVLGQAAPLLDTTNIQATVFAITQFAVKELTTAYDIMLTANQYERWHAAVWEGRRFYYQPPPETSDNATPDWIVRTDDPRVRVGYDGPSADGMANGIKVQYQDVADGASRVLTPVTNPELANTDPNLAANQAGRRVWQKVTLPNPNSATGAAQIGRAVLDEFNRRRTPGRFAVRGHIQDAAGNWQPGWMPRAGQTILVGDDEDAPVRLIYEAGWNPDDRSLTLNADSEASTIDALLDLVLNGT